MAWQMNGRHNCCDKVILVFKKYSQMKLTMKREALEKMNRLANEMTVGEAQPVPKAGSLSTVLAQFGAKCEGMDFGIGRNALE